MNMLPVVRRLSPALLAAALAGACATARPVLDRDPQGREFLSRVRYIITPEERKAFLALPAEAQPDFIRDFWRRRDPQPATEENEYKTDYFNRIETANRLFSGGGSPGWLQDRGRVYITLGPPDNREAYPRGVTFYGVPTEYWWYGFFVIMFVDERWVDDYRLDPSSATQIAVINQAQRSWNLPREAMAGKAWSDRAPSLQGLDVRIAKADGEGTRFTLVVPYRNIWVKAQGGAFRAEIEVTMKVRDAAGAEVWTFARSFPVEVAANMLKEKVREDFTAEAVAPLPPGSYTLAVTATNANDRSTASLEKAFEI